MGYVKEAIKKTSIKNPEKKEKVLRTQRKKKKMRQRVRKLSVEKTMWKDKGLTVKKGRRKENSYSQAISHSSIEQVNSIKILCLTEFNWL